MLVAPTPTTLRCIAQHDHGLLSGELAQLWRPLHGQRPLSYRLILAVGLHDIVWIHEDTNPRFDPASGRPYDFMSFPTGDRLQLYRRGLDWLEPGLPYVALLSSHHFARLADPRGAVEYLDHERDRQERLAALLQGPLVADGALTEAIAWLRWFDNLSLFLALRPPGIELPDRLDWLTPELVGECPDGRHLELEWLDEETLRLAPFPFVGETRLRLPVRCLEKTCYRDASELEQSWREAATKDWYPRLVGTG